MVRKIFSVSLGMVKSLKVQNWGNISRLILMLQLLAGQGRTWFLFFLSGTVAEEPEEQLS